MRILAFRRARCASALSLTLALGLGITGCGLDDVEIPELDGPSELGLSLKLTVSPDIIVADGFSTALVTVQGGREVLSSLVLRASSEGDATVADGAAPLLVNSRGLRSADSGAVSCPRTA